MNLKALDLNDFIPGCRNFKWSEVLFLNQWDFYCYPDEEIQNNLINVMTKLQWIRDYFQKPIRITSGWRPNHYNKHIGGAKFSEHRFGNAVDFQVIGISAQTVRASLYPLLNHLNIRMEDIHGNWIHIDTKLPGRGGRFFKP